MDRRRFLSTTMLSGVGLMALAGSAAAAGRFDLAPPGCGGGLDHAALVAEKMQILEAEGISGEARMEALRAMTCPGCGRPLIA